MRRRGAMKTQDDSLDGLIDLALEISTKRRETLRRLKEARKRGDLEETLELLDNYLGLDEEIQRKSPKKKANRRSK